MQRFLRKIDAYRTLPSELAEASQYGGTYSLLAIIVLLYLMITEFMDYLTPKVSTLIVMNQQHNPFMDIHFNVDMLSLDCDHVDVLILDTFQEAPLEISQRNYTRTPIENGEYMHDRAKIVNSRPPLVEKKKNPQLEKDWDESSAELRDASFASVIRSHDFTFINFYANWCKHCKHFHPDWMEVESIIKDRTWKDADGNKLSVVAIRVNCVEFADLCKQHNVQYYPNVQLYKSDYTLDIYEGERKRDDVVDYFREKTRQSHHSFMNLKAFNEKKKGCNIKGHITTLRVPGEFHFQVISSDSNLVPSLTNVSHVIHSLMFVNDTTEWESIRKSLPQHVLENVNPLKDTYHIQKFSHKSPQHYVQVVTTTVHGKLIYQLTAQSHIKPEDRTSTPQAKFAYTISPMTVIVKNRGTPLYSFVTSMFSLLGGSYILLRLLYFSTDQITRRYKSRVGKLN